MANLEGTGRVTAAEIRDRTSGHVVGIASVLSTSARGGTVYCWAQYGEPGGATEGKVVYKICRVDVRTMSATPLVTLPGVWF
jgi:hypothetical protein